MCLFESYHVVTMSSTSNAPSNCEQRSVIKFLTLEGVIGSEIYRRLCKVYGKERVMGRRRVYDWISMFKEGRTNTHDEERSRRPSDAINNETVACVRTLLAKIAVILFLTFIERWHLNF